MKNLRYIYWIVFAGLILFYIGAMLRIMHWNYGNLLLLAGLIATVAAGALIAAKGIAQSIRYKSLQVFNILLGVLIIIPVLLYSFPVLFRKEPLLTTSPLFYILTVFLTTTVFLNKNIWKQYIIEEKILIVYFFITNFLAVGGLFFLK